MATETAAIYDVAYTDPTLSPTTTHHNTVQPNINRKEMAKPRVLYWFRTDLRLHDSPALKAALDLDPEVLWPIFTWDPHYVYRARGGLNRWQFLSVYHDRIDSAEY